MKSIGNPLQITESFYNVLVREARLVREKISKKTEKRMRRSHSRTFSSSSLQEKKSTSRPLLSSTCTIENRLPKVNSSPGEYKSIESTGNCLRKSAVSLNIGEKESQNRETIITEQTDKNDQRQNHEDSNKATHLIDTENQADAIVLPDDKDSNDCLNEHDDFEDSDDSAEEKHWSTNKSSLLEQKLSSVQLIPLDMLRTFSVLSFFQPNGPFHQPMRNVLEAFVVFRPDIGYVSIKKHHLIFITTPCILFIIIT